MRVTKNNILQNLEKLGLTQQQFEGILKQYGKHKSAKMAFDQGAKFKEINEGKSFRECMMSYHTADVKCWGVYKIEYSQDKFYIGRSKDIYKRIHQHKKEILKFFKTNEYPADHYLSKVFEFLKSDVMAYYFSVEVLEKCYTTDELQQKEQKYLSKYKDSPNCLNISFIAEKPTNEIDETVEEYEIRKSNTVVRRGRDNRIVFYNKDKSKVTNKRVTESTTTQKQQATEFSFDVPELQSELGHTVYKLYYGDRFIINKGKNLAGSLFLLQKGCGYFLAYKHEKLSKFDLDYWHKFYDFVRKNPGKKFSVEIIFTSTDPFEILVKEQLALNENMKYKKMLNNNLTGYIPTLNTKTNMHNWITPEQVERFYAFVASL